MNKNNEDSIFTSNSKKFQANIKDYKLDSNYKNKLLKLEPNPIPLDESFNISTKMKPNYEKNEQISGHKNELTIDNNENVEVNFKISTLKKSEVTFSDEVIDINTHIKKFSNGKFFYISPAKIDLKILKSVNEHRKTPYSKLRNEDLDLDSEVGFKENNESEGEIKICDEILLSEKGNFSKNIFGNISIELLEEPNKENIDKNNNNHNNCFLEEENDFGVNNILDIDKKFKFNLNKKIENLNKNLNTLKNLKKEEKNSKISNDENNCSKNHEVMNPFSKIEINGSNAKFLNKDSDIENESKIQENNRESKLSIQKKNLDWTEKLKLENELYKFTREKLPLENDMTPQDLNNAKENSKKFVSNENIFPTEIKFHSINKNEIVKSKEIEGNRILKTENQTNQKTIDKINNHNKFKPKSILKNSGL